MIDVPAGTAVYAGGGTGKPPSPPTPPPPPPPPSAPRQPAPGIERYRD